MMISGEWVVSVVGLLGCVALTACTVCPQGSVRNGKGCVVPCNTNTECLSGTQCRDGYCQDGAAANGSGAADGGGGGASSSTTRGSASGTSLDRSTGGSSAASGVSSATTPTSSEAPASSPWAPSSSTSSAAQSTATSTLPPAVLVFQDGFEGAFPGLWGFNGSAPTVAPGGAGFTPEEGSHVLDVLFAPTQSTPSFTAVTLARVPFTLEEDWWLGVSVLFGRYSAPYPLWLSILGVHGLPGPQGAPNWNCNTGNEPVSLSNAAGLLEAAINDGAPPWQQTLVTGHWTRWTLHVRPSPVNGAVEVWQDGTLVAHQNGPNVAGMDSCGHAVTQWYLMLGGSKDNNNTSVQEILYDRVNIAHGANGYEVVQ